MVASDHAQNEEIVFNPWMHGARSIETAQ